MREREREKERAFAATPVYLKGKFAPRDCSYRWLIDRASFSFYQDCSRRKGSRCSRVKSRRMPGARGWALLERRGVVWTMNLCSVGSFVLIHASLVYLANFWRQSCTVLNVFWLFFFLFFISVFFFNRISLNILWRFIDYVCCNFSWVYYIGKFLERKLKCLKKLVGLLFFFSSLLYGDLSIFLVLFSDAWRNFFIKKVMLLKWLIDYGFLFNLLVFFFTSFFKKDTLA